MAKNIDFMGAVFPDVPSVKLPQQGGGLVAFDDTTDATATADKILQGYTAYANGQKLTGTASGGITPSGTIQITQNGTVDVTQYASADVNVSGGGGASNVVTGSFKFEGTTSRAENITLDYNGNGYPIYAMITISGGLIDNTDFADLIRRYAYLTYAIRKNSASTTPTWNGSGNANQSAYVAQFKNSTSSAVNYSQTSNYAVFQFNNAAATSNSSHTKVVQFKDAKTMSVWITGSGTQAYGFPAGIKYDYVVVYSS